MDLSRVFVRDTVVTELKAKTKAEAIRELVEVLHKAKRIPRNHVPEVLNALERREEMGSTGIGRGVGVPHVKHPLVTRVAGAFGRSTEGIEYQALDGAPVYLVFLLVSPQSGTSDHLHCLKKISALANHEDLRRFLRSAADEDEIAELIHEADDRIKV